jgi:hypothetical protein
MALIYENKIRSNKDAFVKKVVEISQLLGINPNWLMFVMNYESGLNHTIVNEDAGATGLIQFMPDTARGLGTSTSALKNMSNVQQLNYVYKYFKQNADKVKKFRNDTDLYLITFFPLALGKPDNYVIGSHASPEYVKKVAKQNPGISKGKSEITVADFKKYVKEKVKDTVNKDGYKFSQIYTTKATKIIPVIIIFAGLLTAGYFLLINKKTKVI